MLLLPLSGWWHRKLHEILGIIFLRSVELFDDSVISHPLQAPRQRSQQRVKSSPWCAMRNLILMSHLHLLSGTRRGETSLLKIPRNTTWEKPSLPIWSQPWTFVESRRLMPDTTPVELLSSPQPSLSSNNMTFTSGFNVSTIAIPFIFIRFILLLFHSPLAATLLITFYRVHLLLWSIKWSFTLAWKSMLSLLFKVTPVSQLNSSITEDYC